MTDQSQPVEQISIVLKTATARIIAFLAIAALLLGLIAEGITITINYYSLRKLKCELAESIVKIEATYRTQGRQKPRWEEFAEDCIR